MKSRLAYLGILAAIAVFGCVLSFYQMTDAAPPAQMPFASGEQRSEMVTQLKEINAQLKELNALMRSGELKVIARPEEKEKK